MCLHVAAKRPSAARPTPTTFRIARETKYAGGVSHSFADVLRSGLELMAQRARAPFHAHALYPWVELAASAGPVPIKGPLSHDLLLPAKRSGSGFGLNVFQHDRPLDFDVCARRFARDFLGTDETVAELLSLPDVKAHGGILCSGPSLRLKLYFTAGLDALAKPLGLDPAGAEAFGVDVTADGLCRARRYLRTTSTEGFATDVSSVSHRLLTQLDGEGSKVTYNTIFLPETPADVLTRFARGSNDDAYDHHLAAELTALVTGAGLSLRAVAHEVDAFADGTRTTDALVAIGTPIP